MGGMVTLVVGRLPLSFGGGQVDFMEGGVEVKVVIAFPGQDRFPPTSEDGGKSYVDPSGLEGLKLILTKGFELCLGCGELRYLTGLPTFSLGRLRVATTIIEGYS